MYISILCNHKCYGSHFNPLRSEQRHAQAARHQHHARRHFICQPRARGISRSLQHDLHRRARLGLGYLPQEASIFRKLTVRQNFLGVLEALGVGRAERQARASALLAEYRLEKVADSLGEQLSGGERRRAEVARSLLSNPRYILFDEPFAGVDPIAVGELQRLIGGLRDRGIGVLITDHNVREALGICGRAYILSSGTLLEAGSPAEIAASPRARAVYLGEKFRLDDHATSEHR